MSYNIQELPKYLHTAGKITVITSLLGVVIFAVVFLLNLGAKELTQAEAQGIATTTLTVLNTPPQWTEDAIEQFESSTANPTNSGSTTSWVAIGTDSNNEDYYLLICSGSNAPTANVGAAPSCGGGDTKWAVSPVASSGTQARAATTTIDSDFASLFTEENNWYAWICDSVAVNPRCNTTAKQGTNATNTSPFYVNSRPDFTLFADSSPANPGATITFFATSSDPDTNPAQDNVQLFVCSTNSFNSTSSLGCNGTELASSTLVASDPSASYTIASVIPDQNYAAYGFVVDEHGHEASGGAHGTDSVITVNNVAPTIAGGQISLNGGLDMTLTQNAGETTGFDLQFYASDQNSCQNASAGDEISDYLVSVYRSGVGTTSCDGITGGQYDPNDCYTTAVATTTWNIACTASSTSCTGTSDPDVIYDCTFPLWYVADPTDGTSTVSFYNAEDWRAAVSAIDDDGATTTNHTQSTTADIEVVGFMYMALDTLAIPYSDLEPGQQTDPLVATTTIRAEGNVGIDELLSGEAMCGTYTSAVTCPNSTTSTIPENQQVFATSSVSYGFATSSGNTLSSSTQKLLDINVYKPTATSTQTTGVTYWGIRVPASITTAGLYTGENVFYGVQSHPLQWVP